MGGPEINQLYGDSAIELRRSLGDALISEFCHRYDWLNDLLKGIGPDDWEKPCYHFAMTRPVEGFIPIMLSELAVHGWDIRSNIEHTPSVSKACLPALIKKLPSNRYPWSLPFESEFVAEPKCLRFQFTDTGERLDVVVEECKVTMQPSGDGLADLSLTSDSNTYVLLMYGRRTLASFLSEGLFAAEGDLRIVSDIDRWLAGC